jgi:hypothetical protein
MFPKVASSYHVSINTTLLISRVGINFLLEELKANAFEKCKLSNLGVLKASQILGALIYLLVMVVL